MVDMSVFVSWLDIDLCCVYVSFSKYFYQIGVFGFGIIGLRVYELVY